MFLSGCGGSTASSADSAGVDHAFGPIATRSVGGIAEPVTMQGSQSSVTGVFGANFLSATVALAPENQLNELALLNTTTLAYSNIGRPALLDYGTGSIYALNPATAILSYNCSPTFSGTGTQIAAAEKEGYLTKDIFVYSIDGSSRTRITNGLDVSSLSWSPVGSKIVFSQGGDIWVINSNGTGLTNLTNSPGGEFRPRWNPSGTKIGFTKNVDGDQHFWEMDANGSNQVEKVGGLGNIASWDYDPTGNEIVFITDVASNDYIYRVSLVTFASYNLLSAGSDVIKDVTWSPQGSHIAYIREIGGAPRIEAMRLSDRTTTNVRSLLTTSEVTGLEWGPLIRKRSFIAPTSGVLGTNAAGFLYGMVHSNFASFLAFDAVTRNTVDIDVPPNDSNTSNFFATITAADSINMLRYVNGFSTPRITVVDPVDARTYIRGAIVSFDAAKGTVAAILPFNRSRSGDKPTRTVQGNKVTYRGQFLGVWDGDGKNSGSPVSEVTFDVSTGKVLSQR